MRYADKVGDNPRALEIVAKVAKGNDDAGRFLWAFWNFSQCLDDLVDRDKSVTTLDVATELVEFVGVLSFNAFYLQHKASIFPLLVNACDRWVRGEEMPGEMGRVVRCGDLDVIATVAFLVGGWDHMQTVSAEVRQYDRA